MYNIIRKYVNFTREKIVNRKRKSLPLDSTVADDKVEPGFVLEQDGEQRVDGVQPENIFKKICEIDFTSFFGLDFFKDIFIGC